MGNDRDPIVIKDTDVNEATPGEFPLDAIILFPYVNEKMGCENTWWAVITRGHRRLDIQEQDDKLIHQDSQRCPADEDYSGAVSKTFQIIPADVTTLKASSVVVGTAQLTWDFGREKV